MNPHTPNDPSRQATLFDDADKQHEPTLFDETEWQGNKEGIAYMKRQETAQHNRDVGIGKISDNNADWLAICVQLFPYCYLDTFTGEDLRHFYEARHLQPTHHNAYGALIRQLLKLELIRATGERRHMKDPQSHARLTDVYVKL